MEEADQVLFSRWLWLLSAPVRHQEGVDHYLAKVAHYTRQHCQADWPRQLRCQAIQHCHGDGQRLLAAHKHACPLHIGSCSTADTGGIRPTSSSCQAGCRMLLVVLQLHNTAEAPCALQTELNRCTAQDHMPCSQACRHAPSSGQ